jgi:hypothetical protein
VLGWGLEHYGDGVESGEWRVMCPPQSQNDVADGDTSLPSEVGI